MECDLSSVLSEMQNIEGTDVQTTQVFKELTHLLFSTDFIQVINEDSIIFPT